MPKFARRLYYFFGTFINKYCWKKIVNTFAFLFGPFSPQNATRLDAGLDVIYQTREKLFLHPSGNPNTEKRVENTS